MDGSSTVRPNAAIASPESAGKPGDMVDISGIVEEALGLRRGTRGEDDDAEKLRRARASGTASGGDGELAITAVTTRPRIRVQADGAV